MNNNPIQNHYPEDVSHCYGCGRLNEEGLQIKTYWDGNESTTEFRPRKYHTAIPGYVYGGLIASLIDCHGTGTASAAMAEKRKIELKNDSAPRFVTASLTVHYKRPTPIDTTLIIIGKVDEITERKVIVSVKLYANKDLCAEGSVVTVEMPAGFVP